ncbi:MAG: hypothetical protein LBK96_02930 [Prevotellaceae bacterium]|jgi:hypothetical protein|nr:hypothetical protein [Prevotellaceae bacterium]
MKILSLNFYKLRNEEWFQLFTEFRDLVLKYNPGAPHKFRKRMERLPQTLRRRAGTADRHASSPRSAECFGRPGYGGMKNVI